MFKKCFRNILGCISDVSACHAVALSFRFRCLFPFCHLFACHDTVVPFCPWVVLRWRCSGVPWCGLSSNNTNTSIQLHTIIHQHKTKSKKHACPFFRRCPFFIRNGEHSIKPAFQDKQKENNKQKDHHYISKNRKLILMSKIWSTNNVFCWALQTMYSCISFLFSGHPGPSRAV